MRLAAAEVPSTSLVAAGSPGGLFSEMPLFGGAPLMPLTGRGMADSRDRRPPDKDEDASSTNRKIAELLARHQAERAALAAEIEAEQRRRD